MAWTAGAIDAFELSRVFKGMNITVTPEEVGELLATVDKDGSGAVDFPEFCKMMAMHLYHNDEQELKDVFDKLADFLQRPQAVPDQYSPDEVRAPLLLRPSGQQRHSTLHAIAPTQPALCTVSRSGMWRRRAACAHACARTCVRACYPHFVSNLHIATA